jgi:hypothetical protein
MGKIKFETTSHGRNNHEWDAVNLNNVKSIYILIKNRSKFEETFISRQYQNSILSNGIPDFIENITCLYIDIDRYIQKTIFSNIQKLILRYIMLGYSFGDIANILNKRFNYQFDGKVIKIFYYGICRRIFSTINYEYVIWLEASEKIKIKSTSRYGQCSSCKKFYNLKSVCIIRKFNDKRYFYCKNCKSYADWKSELKKNYGIAEVKP